MKSERGFAYWLQLGAALAVLIILAAVVHWIDKRGYTRGKLEVQNEWSQANAKAAAEQRAREQDVSDAIKEKEAQRTAAAVLAADNYTRWQEALRNGQRNGTALATCTRNAKPDASVRGGAEPAPGNAAADPAVVDRGDRDGGARFTAEFLRLYDAAWAGLDGKPVFEAAPRREGAAEASGVGPSELLGVHGENAKRCSDDRIEFHGLLEKLRAAERAWGSR